MSDPRHVLDDPQGLVDSSQALAALEKGQILYLPTLGFELKAGEESLLSESILGRSHKNISYDRRKQRLGGHHPKASADDLQALQSFMHRFTAHAEQLLQRVLPHYQPALIWGRTSYRPAQILGRSSSKRKDDTRVHVDAFPASPVNGQRILRLFCNINPAGEPRRWQVGEPFQDVLRRFGPDIPPYSPLKAKLLRLVRATKSLRSPYDHSMLQLHDRMKLDDNYQHNVVKHNLAFPPHSSWLVFTDQVSHAALSGQFLLEQTYYLPVQAMQNPELSPFMVLKQGLIR